MPIVLDTVLQRDRSRPAAVRMLRIGPNAGVLIFFLAVTISLVAATGNPWLVTVAAALAGVAVSALIQPRPRALRVRLAGPVTLAAGDSAPYTLSLTNLAGTTTGPLSLLLEAPGFEPAVVLAEPLATGQSQEQQIRLTAGLRGAPGLALIQVESGDPLALLQTVRQVVAPFAVLAHPPVVQAPTLTATAVGELPTQQTRRGRGEEFSGLRPYRRGDSRRAIHWRSTARLDQVMVIEHEQQVGTGLVVLVVGPARQVGDELTIATAAALARRELQGGAELSVLGWRETSCTTAPLTSPSALLNWFSHNTFDTPAVEAAIRALPAWARTVAVAAPSSLPAGWRQQFEAQVTARGGQVTWLEPGVLPDQPRAVMANMLELRHAPNLMGAR